MGITYIAVIEECLLYNGFLPLGAIILRYGYLGKLLLLPCRGNEHDDNNTVVYYNSYDPNDRNRE